MFGFVANLALFAADQAAQSYTHFCDFAETRDIMGVVQEVAEEATKCTVEYVNHVNDFLLARAEDLSVILCDVTEKAKVWMASASALMKVFWAAEGEGGRATSSERTKKHFTRASKPRAGAKASVATTFKPRTKKHKGKKVYKS